MKNQFKFLWNTTVLGRVHSIALLALVGFNTGISANSSHGCCGCECSATGQNPGTGTEPKTLWFGRSAGDNLVIDGHRFGYKHVEDCCTYGDFGISYRYQKNFHGKRIAESLFGTSTLNFAGSRAPSRINTPITVADNTLLADYFGLAQDTDNLAVSFNPCVQNNTIDFRLYIGLNELCDGLYLQFNAPLVHTKWSLNRCNSCDSCCNSCTSSGCYGTGPLPKAVSTTCGLSGEITGTLSQTLFPDGYMSSYYKITTPPSATANPITPLASLASALNGAPFGDYQGRSYGRFSGYCNDTKFAGFYCDLGYNFIECPDYHLGLYLKIVAPTGTDMNSDNHVANLFYPVIGDFHWQLGGGISGHWELYNCDDDHVLTAYLQAYATHLFGREQVRTFDLTNGPMSRYMLMKEFTATNTYANKLWSVIDWSTRRAEVKVDAKGEALIEFVYNNSCGFSAGIGYELYGRSKEKVCCPYNTPLTSSLENKIVGLKGCAPVDAPLYGLAANVVQAGVIDSYYNVAYPATPHGLGATQSTATAYKCGAVDNKVALISAANNVVYTNPLIYTNPVGLAGTTVAVEDSASGTPTIAANGAITGLTANPTVLTDASLNKCSAALKGYITNKVFGHIDYTWDDCHNWKPVIYVGAEGEFASRCDKNAMNAWGFWLGGTVAF